MVILIHGNDSSASRMYRDAVVKQFSDKYNQSGTAVSFLLAEDTAWDRLAAEITADGLFAQKKLVVICDLLDAKELREGLTDFLDAHEVPHDTTLIVYESTSADKRLSIVKKLTKETYSKEFSVTNEQDMFRIMRESANTLGAQFARSAEQELCARVGLNAARIRNEVAKLSHASKEITVELVRMYTERSFEDDIWQFVDTLSSGNKQHALRLLEEQFTAGAKPLYLLAMLVRQVRLLIALSGAEGSDDMLARELGLKPFVVKKTRIRRGGRVFSLPRLIAIYQALAKLDNALKSGKGESKVLFTVLIDSVVK